MGSRVFMGLLLSVLVISCQKSEVNVIAFSEYYIKEPIANNTVTAGYITLVNGKKDLVKLSGIIVSPDIVEKAEIHDHSICNGVMSMYKVQEIDLPSGVPV